jgi:hypothetical protein
MICRVLSTAKEQTRGQEDPWLQLAMSNCERYIDLLQHAQGSGAFEAKKQEYLSVLADYREVVSSSGLSV